MEKGIMKVSTKYVITNTQHLINPVGYDSSQPVYEETEVAIFCNTIPELSSLPQGEKLYIHNVHYLTTSRSK